MLILILINIQFYRILFLALKKVRMVKRTLHQAPTIQWKNSPQQNVQSLLHFRTPSCYLENPVFYQPLKDQRSSWPWNSRVTGFEPKSFGLIPKPEPKHLTTVTLSLSLFKCYTTYSVIFKELSSHHKMTIKRAMLQSRCTVKIEISEIWEIQHVGFRGKQTCKEEETNLLKKLVV